jgi:hypothetical protein
MAGGKRHKNRGIGEPFVAIVRSVFESPEFAKLSPYAAKLLLELVSQFKGDNNGNLTAAYSLLQDRGWRSRTTLYRAKCDLIEAGFVYVTRKGRLPNTCELLALTWFSLDVTAKFDPEALACFRPKAYRDKTPLAIPKLKERADWSQPNGGRPVH